MALADLNEAIRLNPTDASAFAWRGRVWRVREDFDKAIADFNEAIRLDPENVEYIEHRNEALRAANKALQQKKQLDRSRGGLCSRLPSSDSSL